MSDKKINELERLRVPFPSDQIGKLPKPTAAQTNAVKQDFKQGVRCTICGGWHHPKVVHLDYVGHAAITNRLLDVDLLWDWEPLSVDQNNLPLFDNIGGLWIKLTILGVTRKGYGHANGKNGGDAVKETIGDAIRNAAMRFGAGLDLWNKGDINFYQEETKQQEVIYYPVDDFKENLPKWLTVIDSGKKTPEEIITIVSSKGVLTEEQIKLIKGESDATA